MLSRIIALAAAALIAAAPMGPAHADVSPLTCHYTFTAWTGGFTADLAITNHGPAIDSWTAHWTFSTPTLATAVWLAKLEQPDLHEIVATPLKWNKQIPTGGMVRFGWTARAADTEVPTDITVNGIPC